MYQNWLTEPPVQAEARRAIARQTQHDFYQSVCPLRFRLPASRCPFLLGRQTLYRLPWIAGINCPLGKLAIAAFKDPSDLS